MNGEDFLGGPYFFLDPGRNPSVFHPKHLARSLAHVPRFGGQTFRHYSVAQHSVRVANWVFRETEGNKTLAFKALLHDAAESVLGDVPSPLKALLGDVYKNLEAAALTAIFELYGLNPELNFPIKDGDLVLLATEARDYAPEDPVPWKCLEGVSPLPDSPDPWDEDTSTEVFLQAWELLAPPYLELPPEFPEDLTALRK